MLEVAEPVGTRSALGPPQLAPWVTLHEERGRKNRFFRVAVNTRDGFAFLLEEEEVELCRELDGTRRFDDLCTTKASRDLVQELYAGGFLTDRPTALDQPPVRRSWSQRMATFLSTLDVHWSDADRLVRVIYHRGARLAFHPVAVAAQLLLALAGVVALVAGLRSGYAIELQVEAGHLPLLLAVDLVAIGIHELAHALVVVHYGRSVRSAGFRLHLGTPAFYVDSVDALLLSRRQRMIQVAAGPWAEWLVTSLVAIALWHSPWPALVPVLLRFVILNTATIASNLMPFVGLDGYLLLADMVRQPDLSRDSQRAAARLGREVRAGRAPKGEDVVLSAYAAMNVLVAGFLIVLSAFFWYQLFGDTLSGLLGLGPLGWLAVVAFVGILLRPTLVAVRPRINTIAVGAVRLGARLRFRLERRWRVRATERLYELPAFRHLGERDLGVVAGRLERIRIGRGTQEGALDLRHESGLVLMQRRSCLRRVDAVVLPQRWADEIEAIPPR